MNRREELDERYQDVMRSYRNLKRSGIALAIFGFLMAALILVVGVYRVLEGYKVWGFVMFLLCGMDFGWAVHALKRNKEITEDMKEFEARHRAVMWLLEEKQNEGDHQN